MARLGQLGGIGCLVMLATWSGVAMLLGLWTDRTLDFWCTYFKGVPIDVNYWWSVLLSLLAPFALLGNVISEIARACV